MKLSYSRLNKYMQCPRSYKYHYLDLLPSSPNAMRDLGVAIHAALHEILLQAKKGTALTNDLGIKVWRQCWSVARIRGFEGFKDGLEMIKLFIKREQETDLNRIILLEDRFDLDFDGYHMRGVIDRADQYGNTIEIIDYKTGRAVPSKDALRDNLQLPLYALAMRDRYPDADILITLDFLRLGDRITSTVDNEQLESLREFVVATGHRIEQDTTWEAELNTNCPFCDHRQVCDVYKEAINETDAGMSFASEADLEAVANKREEVALLVKIATARKKELESILRAHMEKEGELHLGKRRYYLSNYISRRSWSVADAVRVIVNETNMDLKEVLKDLGNVDGKRMKEFIETLESETSDRIWRELDKCMKPTYTSRFSSSKLRSR